MGRDVASLPHQPSGTGGRSQSGPFLRPPHPSQGSPSPDGQHHGGGLRQSPGRHQVSPPLAPDEEPVDVVQGEPCLPQSDSSTREGEHDSGPPVETLRLSDRVVPPTGSGPEDLAPLRSTQRGSVRLPPEPQASNFLRSDPTPVRVASRRLHVRLAGPSGLRLSALRPGPQGSSEASNRRLPSTSVSGSSVARSTMVSNFAPVPVRSATSAASSDGHCTDARVGQVPSQPGDPAPDCVAIIRQSLVDKGFSAEAADIAANFRRKSTVAMYSGRLRIYAKWCSDRAIPPTSATVGQVADFLLHLFNEGRQLASIKGYRSAIAAVHTGFTDGSSVSVSADLMKLVRGLFLRRPTVRTLTPSWNIQVVLEKLAKEPFEPLHRASLKHLTLKTIFLLAAASVRRRSALHALSVKQGHIRFENDGVRLVPDPAFLAENQTLDFLPHPIFLPKIETFSSIAEDRAWCPVRALRLYIKATQSFRGHHTRLFLSINKPHSPISSDTFSRWLVEVIKLDSSPMGQEMGKWPERSVCLRHHRGFLGGDNSWKVQLVLCYFLLELYLTCLAHTTHYG